MRIAVVGGGAAGYFGAIAAAEHNPTAQVCIFEASQNPLEKVRVSGGGRCNVTNGCFEPSELIKNYPRGGKELRGAFTIFQPRDTIDWFARHGVPLKTENDNRVFPVSDQSSSIVDCFTQTADSHGITVRLGVSISAINTISHTDKTHAFEISLPDGTSEQFDRVILATGSSTDGYQIAKSLGHAIVECVPSLFTFKIDDPKIDGLSGISFQNAKLTLILDLKHTFSQTGPLLITHWGLSGPAVLKLSSWGARLLHEHNYQAELIVNFLPDENPDYMYQMLIKYKNLFGKKRVQSEYPFDIPRRYWWRIVELSGAPENLEWNNLTKTEMKFIISNLIESRFSIIGRGVYKEEFVTCGGVNLKEVDFKTMQSKKCPGLFFAGEILDIDGITGGFNFQNAWTTGWIAGVNCSL